MGFFGTLLTTTPLAQDTGTFSCIIPPMSSFCIPRGENSCKPGYKPVDCLIWTGKPAQCNQTFNCVKEEVADSCVPKGTLASCPSNFPAACNSLECCKEQKYCDITEEMSSAPDPTCLVGSDPKGGIKTALGCIPANDLNALVAWILGKVIFIATGIAFILLVIGALQILTSAGNPEKVKAGSELLTSTISGLLLIILSLFLLKLIGVDILHLPGF